MLTQSIDHSTKSNIVSAVTSPDSLSHVLVDLLERASGMTRPCWLGADAGSAAQRHGELYREMLLAGPGTRCFCSRSLEHQ
jgi:hypothetical protein